MSDTPLAETLPKSRRLFSALLKYLYPKPLWMTHYTNMTAQECAYDLIAKQKETIFCKRQTFTTVIELVRSNFLNLLTIFLLLKKAIFLCCLQVGWSVELHNWKHPTNLSIIIWWCFFVAGQIKYIVQQKIDWRKGGSFLSPIAV